MKTYTLTQSQLDKIRHALMLAEYFVQENMTGDHSGDTLKQDLDDQDTYNQARQVIFELENQP